jgi:hypothetical protein
VRGAPQLVEKEWMAPVALLTKRVDPQWHENSAAVLRWREVDGISS